MGRAGGAAGAEAAGAGGGGGGGAGSAVLFGCGAARLAGPRKARQTEGAVFPDDVQMRDSDSRLACPRSPVRLPALAAPTLPSPFSNPKPCLNYGTMSTKVQLMRLMSFAVVHSQLCHWLPPSSRLSIYLIFLIL